MSSQENCTPDLESRLRREARVLRRPAPPALVANVLAALDSPATPAIAPAAAPPAKSDTRMPWSLVVAATVLALVWLVDPFDFVADGKVGDGAPFGFLTSLDDASQSLKERVREIEVEQPLLEEIRLFGLDTGRTATSMARDLPGPLGGLFDG